MRPLRLALAATFLLAAAGLPGVGGLAAEPQLEPEVLATKLNWPSGVAVVTPPGAESLQLVVAEAGSRSIWLFDPVAKQKQPLVQWRPADAATRLPKPICVVSLSSELFVATDSTGPAVRIYSVKPSETPLTEENAVQSLVVDLGATDVALCHPGLDARYCYLPYRGAKNGLLRSRNNLGVLGEFQSAPGVKIASPGQATSSPNGYVVVSEMGDWGTSLDSRLTFYDPTSPTDPLRLDFALPLADMVAIAYSPITKQLYALDLNWNDPPHGGLYRLEIGAAEPCIAVKLLELTRPAAMAFGAGGELYVVTVGAAPGGKGELVKIVFPQKQESIFRSP